MKKRMLGTLEVSEIGIGCMGFSHGYGQIPDEQYSIEAIHDAYEAGCTFFDTAEGYAPNLDPSQKGHNEKILGKAISTLPRENLVIATKLRVGTEEGKEKGVYASVKEHLMASLSNLNTDYVDLYYLHRINPDIPVEEVAQAMEKLVAEGLIRGWGLSQVPVEIIDRAHKTFQVSTVQNIYSMVERGVEENVMPYLLENNIGLVPFSPIASGLLSGKVSVNTKFEKFDDVRNFVPQLTKENIAGNQPIVDLLKEYAQMKDATPAQISLAWMLHKYPNVVPIPGSKNKERILENLGSCNVALTDEEFVKLETALNGMEVFGHRGYDESSGSVGMQNWGKK